MWYCQGHLRMTHLGTAWTREPVLMGFKLEGWRKCVRLRKNHGKSPVICSRSLFVLFRCHIMRLWCAERVEPSLLHKPTDIPVTFTLADTLKNVFFFFIPGKTCEQPLPPHVLTMMWLVTRFPKRQIWSLAWCHVHLLKRQQSCGVSSFAFGHTGPALTFLPFPASSTLTWRKPSVDYASRSHQSQTARLLTLGHL